jgi:hypothetical protein
MFFSKKKQQNDCEQEVIDTQNGRNNQQQVQYISYLKLQKDMVNILLVSTKNPP